MATEFLIWTCVFVFMATAVITLLALINKVDIGQEFKSKLFYTLIIEIVVSGVIVFKNTVVKQPINIVRVAAPGYPVSMAQGQNLFITGFCQKQPDVAFKGSIKIGAKMYELNDFKLDDRNIYTAYASMNEVLPNSKARILVTLSDKNEVVFKDSLDFELEIK